MLEGACAQRGLNGGQGPDREGTWPSSGLCELRAFSHLGKVYISERICRGCRGHISLYLMDY